MSADLITDAKSLLAANGYVVLKEKSYRQAQERQRIAEALRAMEEDRRRSTEAWAHRCLDEERRLRDRLEVVWGIATAHGATVEDLRG